MFYSNFLIQKKRSHSLIKNPIFGFLYILFLFISCKDSTEHFPGDLNNKGLHDVLFDADNLLFTLNQLRTNFCECGDKLMPAVTPLKWNLMLVKAAQKHSEDMYANKFIDHTGSDGSNVLTRAFKYGYKGQFFGEIIAF